MVKSTKSKLFLLALLLIFFIPFLSLSGCGGSKSPAAGTTPVIPATVDQSSLTLSLTKVSDGTPTTSVSGDSPARLTAVAINPDGSPVANKTVTFTAVTAGLITFNGTPDTGTALTNASGVATIIIYAAAAVTSGATDINAAVTGSAGTISGSTGISVAPANLHLSALTITPGAISAGGSAAVSITVEDVLNHAYLPPVPVSFTSTGVQQGKAKITAQVFTVNGIASATYTDINFGATDTITATLVGTALTQSGPLTVGAASAGSIIFVSATPTNISLPGTGGTITSTVVFKVLNSLGLPLGVPQVDFSLSTTAGGITINPPSAPSDALTGLVSTMVTAGTIPTPVRVSATIHLTPLTSTSNQLVISTGIPTQNNTSLAATVLNMEGWNVDGVLSVVTARLSDRFQNPVPNGTAVSFTASGGQIDPSCTTTAGACSVNFHSAEHRPRLSDPNPKPYKTGRVVILAYALGEESFNDSNANGIYDLSETFTDMPDPWLDVNEDGTYDQNEPFTDTYLNGFYAPADGIFNGVLRDPFIVGHTFIHVRRSLTIVLSTSQALITVNPHPIPLDQCVNGILFANTPVPVDMLVTDLHGNIMPMGTTISIATTNGTIISPVSMVVGNDSPMDPDPYTILMQSDATQDVGLICTNSKTTGLFQVTVRSPGGTVTYGGITTVTD